MNIEPLVQPAIAQCSAICSESVEDIEWSRLFRNAARGQPMGVVMCANVHGETIHRSIESIFAAHHEVGWRASLWVVVVVADGCPAGQLAVARRLLGAFGEVLTVPERWLIDHENVGRDAISAHFSDKAPKTVILNTTISCAPTAGASTSLYIIFTPLSRVTTDSLHAAL